MGGDKTMLTLSDTAELRRQIKAWRRNGETIAFVPTMGNLHQGHLSLVQAARQRADRVVASIFVNPMQFDDTNDLDAYPRTLDADSAALAGEGVDLLFTPTPAIIYPKGLEQQTFVEVPGISDILCGESRPGHFRGVATVVTKLFNLVQPDIACFGEKDYQQLRVIRLMVEDLSMDIEIVGVPTCRESDGLAMSSRNGYLTADERDRAPLLAHTMRHLGEQLSAGADVDEAIARAVKALNGKGFETDYIKVRNALDLQPARSEDRELVILMAAFLGKARLIDNLVIRR